VNNDQRALIKMADALDLARMAQNIENPSQEIQVFTIDLGQPATEQRPFKVDFPFKSIFIRDATDTSVQIFLKPMTDNTSQGAVAMKINDSMTFGSRMRASLFWNTQPSKTMTIVVLAASQFSSGTLNSQNAGGVSINDGSSATLAAVTLVAATVAAIVPVDTTRKTALVQNKTGSDLYLGVDNQVLPSGTNEGILISAGQTITWRNTAALWAYSVTGGKVTVLSEK
jgi:hypothetical protein